MRAIDIPYKFAEVWAKNASASFITNPIPPTIGGAAASQNLGFPPTTADVTGTPPDIADFNGMMFYETAWSQWLQAGGAVPYDATFQTNIGGYPAGAIIQSATTAYLKWLSTADNNTSNPDTGGANWVAWPTHGLVIFTSTTVWNVPLGVTLIRYQLWGGGGGGGASSGSGGAAAGGGAGSYLSSLLSVTPGGTVTAVIGSGGAGGTGSGDGGNGGNSQIGGAVAGGGAGGQGATTGPATGAGAGGSAGTATIAINGGPGGPGLQISSLGIGGFGGTSPFFGTTPPLTTGNGSNGSIGQGGSGGANAGGTGGNGGGGAAIFSW